MARRAPQPEPYDYLNPPPPKTHTLSWEGAQHIRRPRRCNVSPYRRGGAICCDLCVNQVFSGRMVYCYASEDPPLFRPRNRDGED